MNNLFKGLRKNFELYLGSIFLSITTVIVIMNVFTRYVLNFTYYWAEEVAVGAFVWVIFLGVANAYKTRHLIGVEALVVLLPERGRGIVEFITSIILTVLSGFMFFFSYKYVSGSTKITAALEISYKYINAGIVIAFGLITIYSIYFLIENFKKTFLTRDDNN